MKYSEIYGQEVKEPLLACEKAAVQVLHVLDRRKAFDHWWSDVSPQDKDDIFEKVVNAIKEATQP